MVADPEQHYFENPAQDPHYSEKLDPNLDPDLDPHQTKNSGAVKTQMKP
jgi:hypothetical protein